MTTRRGGSSRSHTMLEHIADDLKSDYSSLVNACEILVLKDTAAALQFVIDATKRLQEKHGHWLADPLLQNTMSQLDELAAGSPVARRLRIWVDANVREMDRPSKSFDKLWKHAADELLPASHSSGSAGEPLSPKGVRRVFRNRQERNLREVTTQITGLTSWEAEAVFEDLMAASVRAQDLLTAAAKGEASQRRFRKVEQPQYMANGKRINFVETMSLEIFGTVQIIGRGIPLRHHVGSEPLGLRFGAPKRGQRYVPRRGLLKTMINGWAWVVLPRRGRIEISMVHSRHFGSRAHLQFIADTNQVLITVALPSARQESDTRTFGVDK